MKKKSIFFLILLTVFSVGAENGSAWNFSLEPMLGIKNGLVQEYVFQKNCPYSDDTLSRLDWDMKNIWYMGLKATGGWNRITTSAYFTVAIPNNSGSMEDSDWQNVTATGLNAYQYKTNYSESDNYLNYNYSFGIQGGYTFKPLSFLDLLPFIGLDYDCFKFTAKDGDYWYGNYNSTGKYYYQYKSSNSKSGSISGDVITYRRETYLTWVGLSGTFYLPNNFSILLEAKVAPYVYTWSEDNHLLRSINFVDICDDYFAAAKCGLGVSYKISKRNAISLNSSFLYIKEHRGSDYYKKENSATWKTSSTEGGASQWNLDFSLSWKISIL